MYKGATVSGESRCVESWLCAIFITCMVHGSVDLPSALVHCYIRCENVGGCGAHETVFDCHDVAFDHECHPPHQHMSWPMLCVCVRPVVLFSVTADSQAVLWHCIDCSANSLPVCWVVVAAPWVFNNWRLLCSHCMTRERSKGSTPTLNWTCCAAVCSLIRFYNSRLLWTVWLVYTPVLTLLSHCPSVDGCLK